MSLSATAKLRKRVARSEDLVIGMGFLLLRLHDQFGGQMSAGMKEQTLQAISDYRTLCRSIEQRAAISKATGDQS